MCGIVGYIGHQAAAPILLEGLRRLEYRGYDSAGIALMNQPSLYRLRAKGKLSNMALKLQQVSEPCVQLATVGIGHTRWATHGKPEEHNAHPHTSPSGQIAVIQNGIVENYRVLRQRLMAEGYVFATETDTEVIPHLVDSFMQQGYDWLTAIRTAVAQLEGAFAIAMMHADHPQELVVVRQQAPLVLGLADGEAFFASDTPALVNYSRRIVTLDNGQMARLSIDGIELMNFEGHSLPLHSQPFTWNPIMVEKQGYRHFMLKEIHEQPATLRASLQHYLSEHPELPVQTGLPAALLQQTKAIDIVACGTSWHASLIGKHLLEQLAGIRTTVHYASEYRYAPPPLAANTLTIGVTQSGETADTLAAMQLAQQRDPNFLLAITSRADSILGRLVPHVLPLHAGVEIGVAATKTFTAQVLTFYVLALEFAISRQNLGSEAVHALIAGLRQLPVWVESILTTQAAAIEALAHHFPDTQDFIYLGRGINYPIALEGALKLKEISYIHAEGYPAGEMKHGPIALLDHKVPVVAVAMPGPLYEKVISNAQEAKARDALLVGIVSANDTAAAETFDLIVSVPEVPELLSPLVAVIPLQLLAYHIAALRGLDVDQPRNLAKSVTVE